MLRRIRSSWYFVHCVIDRIKHAWFVLVAAALRATTRWRSPPKRDAFPAWLGEEEPSAEEQGEEGPSYPPHLPRVLNANFADARTGCMLSPFEGLVAGEEYDFLVDVGPRWETTYSLVTGNAVFPEHALPQDQEGYVIQVVLLCEQFTPQQTAGWIWLPRTKGRSYVYSNGERGDTPGAVALRIRAPGLPNITEDAITAYGRLYLYYQNNLLQSAAVEMGVVRAAGIVLGKANVINVDYVLTGTFEDVGRFEKRTVQFGAEEEPDSYPISVSIALNDDETRGHRILVKNHPDLLPSWLSYDPLDAKERLDDARAHLADCCGMRDKRGDLILDKRGERLSGLNPQDNSKTREQFQWDLFKLAELGVELFDAVFTGIKPGKEGQIPTEWAKQLRETLADGAVIQVARTTPANYVFPWALVYEHPLPGPRADLRFCPVIEQWSEEGRRPNPAPGTSCPYKAESDHQSNILCPYGFWGLKHIIEQPTSPLSALTDKDPFQEAQRELHAGASLRLNVAVTQDTRLNAKVLKSHIATLPDIPRVQLWPSVAYNRNKVRELLAAPSLVYFLCHGEYDRVQKDPYLGIGPRDDQPIHKVYRKDFSQWLQTLDPAIWKTRRPLIFINGCHTANLEPGHLLNFVTTFVAAGASGVIGTEISVVLPVAVEIAHELLARLARGIPVGQALLEVRWKLANKGNLLGLAYTPYCLADLNIVFS